MLATTSKDGPIVAEPDELPQLAALQRLLHESQGCALKVIGQAGIEVDLPASVVQVVRQAVDALTHDQVVMVTRLTKELTTDEAADLLGVPHAHLLQLLEQGALPSQTVRGRRRVGFADLMAFRQQRDTERRRLLDEFAQESQEVERRVG